MRLAALPQTLSSAPSLSANAGHLWLPTTPSEPKQGPEGMSFMEIFEADWREDAVTKPSELPEKASTLPESQTEPDSVLVPALSSVEPKADHALPSDRFDSLAAERAPEGSSSKLELPDYAVSPSSPVRITGALPGNAMNLRPERVQMNIGDTMTLDARTDSHHTFPLQTSPHSDADALLDVSVNPNHRESSLAAVGIDAVLSPVADLPDPMSPPELTAYGQGLLFAPGDPALGQSASNRMHPGDNSFGALSDAMPLSNLVDRDGSLPSSGVQMPLAATHPWSTALVRSGFSDLMQPRSAELPVSNGVPSGWTMANVLQGKVAPDPVGQEQHMAGFNALDVLTPAETSVLPIPSTWPLTSKMNVMTQETSSPLPARITEEDHSTLLHRPVNRQQSDSTPGAAPSLVPVRPTDPLEVVVLQTLPSANSDHFMETETVIGDDHATTLSAQIGSVTRADGISPKSDILRPVLQQLVDAAVRAVERPVDLHLNPEELGPVRISMTMNDGSITMSLLAERAETLDLMRRHSDLLAQDLRQLGYGTISFTFGQHGQGHEPKGGNLLPDFRDKAADTSETATSGQAPIHHDTGLDIWV